MNQCKNNCLVLILTLLFSYNFVSIAQIPLNPSVQMLITDNSGSVVTDGQYEITTTLYESTSGNTSVWSETQTANVSKGLVNLILGKTQTLNIAFAKPYYLGISIDNGNEMIPRLELNSSAYSLSARAVYGTTNIFPSAGSVGIGTYSPRTKLDIRGDLSILDVPIADSNKFYRILVHDTLNQIVKYIPDSIARGPKGLKGPIGLIGPIGPIGPKGAAGPNGLNCWDLNGNGIKDGFEDFDGNGVVDVFDCIGPRGLAGANGLNCWDLNGNGIKDGFEDFDGDGVVDIFDCIGPEGPEGPRGPKGDPGVIGVPGEDLIVRNSDSVIVFRVNAEDGTSFHAGTETFRDTILIVNENGDTVFWVAPDGTSYHGGKEIFRDTIVVVDSLGNPRTELTPEGAIITRDSSGRVTHVIKPDGTTVTYGPGGKPVFWVKPDGTSYHGGTETFRDTIIIINENRDTVFWVAPDGTSYHKGKEIFADTIVIVDSEGNPRTELPPNGGIVTRGPDGKITKLTKPNGTTIIYGPNGEPVFWVKPDGTSYHGGKETFRDTVVLLGPDGEPAFWIAPDGTSFHKGKEIFADSIIIVDSEGNPRTELPPNGGLVTRGPDGRIVYKLWPDGTSEHFAKEYFYSGMEIGYVGVELSSIRVKIDPEQGLIMYDRFNNIIFSIDGEGNSFHAGFEQFKGGLSIPFAEGGRFEVLPDGTVTIYGYDGTIINQFSYYGSYHALTEFYETGLDVNLVNGNIIHLCRECGIVLQSPTGELFKVDVNGDSYHSGHEFYFNGIETYDSNQHPSIKAQAIVADLLMATEKNFRIDHPLDPANKYLYHSSMESSERLNLYNGNILLDENGTATINLPDWFEALNENYRYQLTPIGGAAPNIYIAKEVNNNKFSIAGGSPGMKISWQVSGTRKDDYAKATPFKIESDKPINERGKYWDTPIEPKKSTEHKCNSNFKKHNFLKK